ncbi:MAG: hypothetical protein COT89_01265 [Candidatus Colwellbacteria bacterium CG10_big_fil_rev_8_21_14_0_10_42_22]|uniref:DNA replication/recombination mediator RecO N-terminal domain-containing protein n=1 Tax=Candidatus Colwellbacteria bacterium CG10_big_fil_rev_8_21_14_0_10_42_22 TaxID=1974540 RepID=A0A2H0VG08_9BACT|nr:MAG: hypothetical protein COT89_01265 [Candidatus Colwellbacteria bacterium CG10_big_fil_rev_8_21_14_0_10_42_22]
MAEYYTPAIVLRKDVKNDKDSLYILYTRSLGKISAIAKSARKITSKLSGHLSPGRIADIRLIDKGSFQLLDALSKNGGRSNKEIAKFLYFLDNMTPYNQADPHLWYIAKEVVERLEVEPIVYREILGIMGFAPIEKNVLLKCNRCKKIGTQTQYFIMSDLVFLCANCLKDVKIEENDLVKIV